MDSIELTIRTGDEPAVVDITGEVAVFCRDRGDGLVSVFVPHATAGVAVMETGAGSDTDLLAALAELLPRDGRWGHRHGSPGHGADHVLPALVPPSLTDPGPARPPHAGHLAVDRAGGHQRRQPHPHGPPQLPPGLTRSPRAQGGEAIGVGGGVTRGNSGRIRPLLPR